MRGSRSKIKKLLAVLLAVTVMTSSFDVKAVASAIEVAVGSTAVKVEDSMEADPEKGTEEQMTASGASSEEVSWSSFFVTLPGRNYPSLYFKNLFSNGVR